MAEPSIADASMAEAALSEAELAEASPSDDSLSTAVSSQLPSHFINIRYPREDKEFIKEVDGFVRHDKEDFKRVIHAHLLSNRQNEGWEMNRLKTAVKESFGFADIEDVDTYVELHFGYHTFREFIGIVDDIAEVDENGFVMPFLNEVTRDIYEDSVQSARNKEEKERKKAAQIARTLEDPGNVERFYRGMNRLREAINKAHEVHSGKNSVLAKIPALDGTDGTLEGINFSLVQTEYENLFGVPLTTDECRKICGRSSLAVGLKNGPRCLVETITMCEKKELRECGEGEKLGMYIALKAASYEYSEEDIQQAVEECKRRRERADLANPNGQRQEEDLRRQREQQQAEDQRRATHSVPRPVPPLIVPPLPVPPRIPSPAQPTSGDRSSLQPTPIDSSGLESATAQPSTSNTQSSAREEVERNGSSDASDASDDDNVEEMYSSDDDDVIEAKVAAARLRKQKKMKKRQQQANIFYAPPPADTNPPSASRESSPLDAASSAAPHREVEENFVPSDASDASDDDNAEEMYSSEDDDVIEAKTKAARLRKQKKMKKRQQQANIFAAPPLVDISPPYAPLDPAPLAALSSAPPHDGTASLESMDLSILYGHISASASTQNANPLDVTQASSGEQLLQQCQPQTAPLPRHPAQTGIFGPRLITPEAYVNGQEPQLQQAPPTQLQQVQLQPQPMDDQENQSMHPMHPHGPLPTQECPQPLPPSVQGDGMNVHPQQQQQQYGQQTHWPQGIPNHPFAGQLPPFPGPPNFNPHYATGGLPPQHMQHGYGQGYGNHGPNYGQQQGPAYQVRPQRAESSHSTASRGDNRGNRSVDDSRSDAGQGPLDRSSSSLNRTRDRDERMPGEEFTKEINSERRRVKWQIICILKNNRDRNNFLVFRQEEEIVHIQEAHLLDLVTMGCGSDLELYKALNDFKGNQFRELLKQMQNDGLLRLYSALDQKGKQEIVYVLDPFSKPPDNFRIHKD